MKDRSRKARKLHSAAQIAGLGSTTLEDRSNQTLAETSISRPKRRATLNRERARAIRNALRGKSTSTLRIDPTRLGNLRRTMEVELNRRFALLKGRIVTQVPELCEGLKLATEGGLDGMVVANANPRGCNQYSGSDCKTDIPPSKPTLDEFQEWQDKGWSWGEHGWEPPQHVEKTVASDDVPQEIHAAARSQLTDKAKQTIAAAHDWERTKPWNADKDDLPIGVRLSKIPHGEVAHFFDGEVNLSPKFFDPNEPYAKHEDASRHVVWHELGHQLADTMVNDGTSFQLHDAGVIPAKHDMGSGTIGGHGDEEALADAYALLHTDPKWLHDHYPKLVKPVMDRARALGMPLPSSQGTHNVRVGSLFHDLATKTEEGGEENCGTGQGGFKPGNTCGSKSKGSSVKDVRAAQSGDHDALVKVLQDNHGAVVKFARKYASGNELSRQEFDDLVQEGQLGLMRAVQKFDPTKEAKFITHAWHWIRSKIGSAMRRIHRTRKQEASLEGLAGKGEGEGKGSRFEPTAPVEHVPESHESERELERVLATMHPRDQDILRRRFGLGGHEPQTQEEIGKVHGLTKMRISQIERKALEHMRGQMSENAWHVWAEPEDEEVIANADALIEVPDVRQRDTFSCGAAAAMTVGAYWNAGPDLLDDWKKELGTTEEKSTSPEAIVNYLQEIGLRVTAKQGMTLDELTTYVRQGTPILTPIQEYGVPSKQASMKYGHWVVVIGVAMGFVFVQDPSLDNVLQQEKHPTTEGLPEELIDLALKFAMVPT